MSGPDADNCAGSAAEPDPRFPTGRSNSDPARRALDTAGTPSPGPPVVADGPSLSDRDRACADRAEEEEEESKVE
jgi:hypothetical protein